MARRSNHELAFTALTIEGGLLAPDFLNKVAHLEAPEQTEADYDIPRGLKLRDEIGRHWKIAQNLWEDFSAKRSRTDVDGFAVTTREFLEPFLRHVLCFTDMRAVGQVTLNERVFPIGFAASESRVPIVLAAHDQLLDKPGSRHGDGTRRRTPFLLAQEYLNAAQGALWAVVSNGLKIRILRDNPSLTRPAYIEADLEAIFNEGLYPDFTALWLLAHGSRFGKADAEPVDCPLERWRNTAQEDGIRARDRLRVGVTDALRALGTGFLTHPDNRELRHRIEAGHLSTQAYFEQLLRLVYRFIFLATIEDRELVFTLEATLEAKSRYLAGYSLQRLRQLAARRRSYDRHTDLWQALTVTFAGLCKGQPALGLPALGGLFDSAQCRNLEDARLDNHSLLSALFSLCFFRDGAVLSRVNYRDMDSEELGSVYESLLELVPKLSLSPGSSKFGFAGDEEAGSNRGNARKLSGSYYTPDSLVQELIRSALEPVIAQTLKANPNEPVKALLNLSVCDPACGSGHFLLAAARRIAEEVARLSSTDGNPLPTDYRHALRDVVSHCIYGVDRNSMAIELARTALWLEAYTPDRPLTFLDAHLRCGDALLGLLDPSVLDAGIPDKALNALSGDDNEVVRRIKKANRDALKAIAHASASSGQFCLGLEAETDAVAFETMSDDTLEALQVKREAFAVMEARLAASSARLAADLFVAAFVLPKTLDNEARIPTSQDLWLVQNGGMPRPGVADASHQAAISVQAFHWWQAFPHIESRGGFDVLLGNPPWEVSQMGEEEYFSTRAPSIAALPGEKRKRAIAALETEDPLLWQEYIGESRRIEATNSFYRESNRFPLTAFGKLNTYSLFAETFSKLLNDTGRAGFIVPTGIATDDSTKLYFQTIADGQLISLFGFRTGPGMWAEIGHQTFKFCLVTLGKAEKTDFCFSALSVDDIEDSRRRFSLSREEFYLLNPNTRTCPIFRSERDAELTKKIYRVAPVLISEGPPELNPWGLTFSQGLFNMTSDSHLFLDEPGLERRPLYEAKMIHQFDHRWATYKADGSSEDVGLHEKEQHDFNVTPHYWVDAKEVELRLNEKGWKYGWLMGWRDITKPQNERTVIASVLPRVGVGNQLPIMLFADQDDRRLFAAILANLSSLALDFVARHKVGGTHLNYFIYKQLPVLPPDRYTETDLAFIVPRVLELTYTANDLKPWAVDLGYIGLPFSWDIERRAEIRAELDAYYAKLYSLSRDELRYILDPTDVMGKDYPSETFRVLKNNEIREFGEYRTQRLVLEAWDRLEAAESRAPVCVPTYSDQGLIRNIDESNFAGIVVEVVRQHPEGLSAGQIQTLVAYAMQPSMLSQMVSQPSALRLTELMNSVCRIEVGAAIQLIPLVLHRLQSVGTCRATRRGDAVIYSAGSAALPADVRCTHEHTELARMLLALDVKRRANAQADERELQTTNTQRGAA